MTPIRPKFPGMILDTKFPNRHNSIIFLKNCVLCRQSEPFYMSRFPKKSLLLILSFSILASCLRNSKETVDIIIRNGKVIDLETGEIKQKDIYIENGRIKNLGNSDSLLLYNGNKLIDAKGKYILPGFWDNHVHFRGGKNLISNNRNFLKLYPSFKFLLLSDSTNTACNIILIIYNLPFACVTMFRFIV